MQHYDRWSHEGFEYGINLRIWIMWFVERRDKVTGRENGAVYICKKKR